MSQSWSKKRFYILVLVVCITGASQGLLIPLLTTLLEEQGVSPDVNGLSATALYVGILIASPLSASLVGRYGYKKMVLFGLFITTLAVALLPFFSGIWEWSVLRFIVGIGDSLLHYATQLWITTTALESERGKRISQYGFAYGLGFGMGPLGLNLLVFGENAPLWTMLGLLVVTLCLALQLQEEASPVTDQQRESKATKHQVATVYRVGLVALCPALLYGFLEAALAGNFPVIGLREGISKSWISVLISAFVWGSLVFQIPLGILGDKIGRKRLLMAVCSIGAVGMFLIPFLMSNVWALFIAFSLIGGMIGSIFSMGLAFLADLLPARHLPTANVIASVHFSLGSMLGPYLGGLSIKVWGGHVLFYLIAGALASFVLLALTYRSAVVAEPSLPVQEKQIG
ncbi:MFS transporter [Laceyella putida]|uniref:MFS transporter n=1 Tax=Laceyella putida TaxID=110101 RepID=A0ABW2RH86_9BACL